MSLAHRKKRPLDRAIPHHRDTRLFVIATEGEQTEPHYFRSFQLSSRVQLRVLPTEDHRSSPSAVLARLQEFRREYALDARDELWLVLDVDRWSHQTLDEICRDGRTSLYQVAVSCPCFEAWLLMHDDDADHTFSSCEKVEERLREVRGGHYSKTNASYRYGRAQVERAIARGRSLHEAAPTERWPRAYGSHVYRLMERLLAFVVL